MSPFVALTLELAIESTIKVACCRVGLSPVPWPPHLGIHGAGSRPETPSTYRRRIRSIREDILRQVYQPVEQRNVDVKLLKVLARESRLLILEYLKDPARSAMRSVCDIRPGFSFQCLGL
ncbi:hypothetical protein [Mesorhizobium sp. INR15]|uniref:hypothetical protein n=1 Tax=Mesorhizobium sp. INR15 TaxID=2654248 RepID=UPI0018967683|nr:hypothetical protein [Mesorhizobium sp. INR15]QPC89840.1 hypothetical protein GA829_04110 [Mesorhizobium sp. INR15]